MYLCLVLPRLFVGDANWWRRGTQMAIQHCTMRLMFNCKNSLAKGTISIVYTFLTAPLAGLLGTMHNALRTSLPVVGHLSMQGTWLEFQH